MLGGTDITARALSVGQQPVYERLPQSTDALHSVLTVSTLRSLQVHIRQIPIPSTRTKKFDKPRRGLGSDAGQRARIMQIAELESGRSQDLNHVNCRKEDPRTVRETAAAFVQQ